MQAEGEAMILRAYRLLDATHRYPYPMINRRVWCWLHARIIVWLCGVPCYWEIDNE